MIYNWKPYFTLKDSVMDPRRVFGAGAAGSGPRPALQRTPGSCGGV